MKIIKITEILEDSERLASQWVDSSIEKSTRFVVEEAIRRSKDKGKNWYEYRRS